MVDNDSIIRSVLRSLLTKIGQTVDHAATTDEALQMAGANRFALVILDLDMPSAGGLHVCRVLRADPNYRDTPIVILTALDNHDSRSRSSQAGATMFVPKPFNPADLMRLLMTHLDVAERDRPRLSEILSSDRGLRLQDAGPGRLHERVPVRTS